MKPTDKARSWRKRSSGVAGYGLCPLVLLTGLALAIPSEACAAEIESGYLASGKAFRAATAKVVPSIVQIESFGGLSGRAAGASGKGMVGNLGDGATTGLIVSPEGHIATSTFNFIRKPPVITVILHDGTRHVAELLGRDATRKICLLKIDAQGMTVPEMAPPDELRIGQWAVSVGLGYGRGAPAVSAGIISALNRINGKTVQTDANISPANYGGPLLDVDGRVIGLCVPLSPQSASEAAGSEWYDSGIGFAVPLVGIEEVLQRLKNGDVIKPGRLGAQTRQRAENRAGAVVSVIAEESPAAKAGVQVDDIILAVDGAAVLDAVHLGALMKRYVAGDTVQLDLERQGDKQQVSVNLESGEDTPPPKSPGADP